MIIGIYIYIYSTPFIFIHELVHQLHGPWARAPSWLWLKLAPIVPMTDPWCWYINANMNGVY